jgi:O-antigen/teichoic acid export membrane protein
MPQPSHVTSLRRNVIANYVGGAWSALMGFAFIPLYIRYLGMESYGLLAVFALLQSWLSLLDLGLTPTLSREMARFRAGALTPLFVRDLMRSVELVYLAIAALTALSVWIASRWLAADWIKPERLSMDAVKQALAVGGFVIALRWLVGLYRNALIGLEKQVWLNLCTAFFSAVRGAGAIAVLAYVSPTIKTFLSFQGICLLIESAVLAVYVRRLLPEGARAPRFSWTSLKHIWRFAAGMTTITLLSILLTQVDKLELSKILPLDEFGYYALASTLAGSLALVIGPINNAVYPRLTLLVSKNELPLLADAYHKSSQVMTLMLVPAAAILSLFSNTVTLLWTHDVAITQSVAPLVRVLTVGTMLNGLMHTPYTLQLAHGWTRFTVIVNLISVAIIVPAIYFAVLAYGTMAAAVLWTILNAGYLLIAVPIMHRRLLPQEMSKWYLEDVLLPTAVACGAVLLIHTFAPAPMVDKRLQSIVVLAIAAGVAFTAALVATPFGRSLLRERFST